VLGLSLALTCACTAADDDPDLPPRGTATVTLPPDRAPKVSTWTTVGLVSDGNYTISFLRTGDLVSFQKPASRPGDPRLSSCFGTFSVDGVAHATTAHVIAGTPIKLRTDCVDQFVNKPPVHRPRGTMTALMSDDLDADLAPDIPLRKIDWGKGRIDYLREGK
jgi:hypothetical protein